MYDTTSPHPTSEKGLFTLHNKCFFQLCIHMRETCISGIPREKKNLSKCKHKKPKFISNRKPG